MNKDKTLPPPHHHGGSLLPPPPFVRYFLHSSSSGSGYTLKSPPSSALPPSLARNDGDANRFSHDDDISKMLNNPPKNLGGHRRAHSEILTLPDDLNFDTDLGGVVAGFDGPSLSDETDEDLLSMYLVLDKFNSSASSCLQAAGDPSAMTTSASTPTPIPSFSPAPAPAPAPAPTGSSERPRIRHQHSQSMDGSTTIKPEMLISGIDDISAADDAKKAMSTEKLAELALIDPKRAKRIWANRQSAARSKERKMRYINELERKVQTLQTESTSLSTQLTLVQRDTSGLTSENSELKLRLQTMEQQVHLQDALNDALKDEIQHLKVLTGQTIPNGGPVTNFPLSFGSGQQFYGGNNNSHAMHTILAAQQFQQLQIHSQKQQQQQHQLHHQLQHQHQHQQLQTQTRDYSRTASMPSPDRKESSGFDVKPSFQKE
ncbi:probable transcription factor PosF21 isoform X3 [Impatiens glandulifera]|nr:probable transcription factor PosF21 isoform X2 [Impatiens glandulifera]XP_047311996.1 probable transcription factor PosF21 isoform X3 [Impatiens glandulifera]